MAIETPALDCQTIADIHRGSPKGFVGIMAKGKDGQLSPIGAIPRHDLKSVLPRFADLLSHDSYFTLNTYWKAGEVWKKTGLPYLLRKEKYLLELVTCYADLDVGRPDDQKHLGATLTWQEAQLEVLRRQNSGLLPPFSLMACSGRGVYLLWFLHDDTDPTKLPRANRFTLSRYKAANRALHDRLGGLACDRIADAARVLRIPGSINTKAGKRVTFSATIQGGDNGNAISYSLRDLEAFLGIKDSVPSLPATATEKAFSDSHSRGAYRKTRVRGSRPASRTGYVRVNRLRAQDLETIARWRGGWLHGGQQYPDGFTSPGRGFMLRLYAGWLCGSDHDRTAVLRCIATMAENCRPPYPSDANDQPLDSIVEDAFSRDPGKHIKNIRTHRLLRLLGIDERTDPDLLASLTTILPDSVRKHRAAESLRQDDFTAVRQFTIDQIVKQRSGVAPTAARMADLLSHHGVVNPATGRPWSCEIIRRDFDVLGYPPAPRGRPSKRPQTASMPNQFPTAENT